MKKVSFTRSFIGMLLVFTLPSFFISQKAIASCSGCYQVSANPNSGVSVIAVGSAGTFHLTLVNTCAANIAGGSTLQLSGLHSRWTLGGLSITHPSSGASVSIQDDSTFLITTVGDDTLSIQFTLSPKCPPTGFNSSVNSQVNFTLSNFIFTYPTSNVCNLTNQNLAATFTIGFPHLEYSVSDNIPSQFTALSNALGSLDAMKNRYYLRRIIISNTGTSAYDFTSSNFDSVTIRNHYNLYGGTPEFQVVGIIDQIPAGFQNGSFNQPTGMLSVYVNNDAAHQQWKYGLKSSVIPAIHFSTANPTVSNTNQSNSVLLNNEYLIYYEVIKINVCTGSSYVSHMNFLWNYMLTPPTVCFSDTCTNPNGTAATGTFNRQLNDPDVTIDGLNVRVSPVVSGSTNYCYGYSNGDSLLQHVKVPFYNNQFGTRAEDLKFDFFRGALGAGYQPFTYNNEKDHTDIAYLDTIRWIRNGAIYAQWNFAPHVLPGTVGSAGGQVSGTYTSVSGNFKVTITRKDTSAVPPTFCTQPGVYYADHFTFDFTSATNSDTTDRHLVLLGAATSGGTAHDSVRIGFVTRTCYPSVCVDTIKRLVAQNWLANCSYSGTCSGSNGTMSNPTAPYGYNGSGIYQTYYMGCKNSPANYYGPDVSLNAGTIYYGANSLMGPHVALPTAATGNNGGGSYDALNTYNFLYGMPYQQSVQITPTGSDINTWSGNAQNQAIEIDIVADEDIFLVYDSLNTYMNPSLVSSTGSSLLGASANNNLDQYHDLTGALYPCTDYLLHNPWLKFQYGINANPEFICDSISSGAKLYRYYFTFNQLGLTNCSHNGPNIDSKLNDAAINFNVLMRCAPMQYAGEKIRTYIYHYPNTATCPTEKILMAKGSRTYAFLCPGCMNQGIESQTIDVYRTNFGYADYDDDGLWDADGSGHPYPVNPDSCNKKNVMVGDTFMVDMKNRIDLWNTTLTQSGCTTIPSNNFYPSGDIFFTHGYAWLIFNLGPVSGTTSYHNLEVEDAYIEYSDSCAHNHYLQGAYIDTVGFNSYLSGGGLSYVQTYHFNHGQLQFFNPTSTYPACFSVPGNSATVLQSSLTNPNFMALRLDYSIDSLFVQGNPNAPKPTHFIDGTNWRIKVLVKQNGNTTTWLAGDFHEMAQVYSDIYLKKGGPESTSLSNVNHCVDPLGLSAFPAGSALTCPSIHDTSGMYLLGCDSIQWKCVDANNAYYYQVGYEMLQSYNTLDPIGDMNNGCTYRLPLLRCLMVGGSFNPAYSTSTAHYDDFFKKEYRHWNHENKMYIKYPNNLTFVGISGEKQKVRGINITAVHNPPYTFTTGVVNAQYDDATFDYTCGHQLFSMRDPAAGTPNTITLSDSLAQADGSYVLSDTLLFRSDCNMPDLIYNVHGDTISVTVYDYFDSTLNGNLFNQHLLGGSPHPPVGGQNIALASGTNLNCSPYVSYPNQKWPIMQRVIYRQNPVLHFNTAVPQIQSYGTCLKWSTFIENLNGNLMNGGGGYSVDAQKVWVMLDSVHNLQNFYLEYDSLISGIHHWKPLRKSNGQVPTGSIYLPSPHLYYIPKPIDHDSGYCNVMVHACTVNLCDTVIHYLLKSGRICGNFNINPGTTPMPLIDSFSVLPTACSAFIRDSLSAVSPHYAAALETGILNNDTLTSCTDTMWLADTIINKKSGYLDNFHITVITSSGLQLVNSGAYVMYHGVNLGVTLPSLLNDTTNFNIDIPNDPMLGSCSTQCGGTQMDLPGLLDPLDTMPKFFVIYLPIKANCCLPTGVPTGTVTVNAELDDTLCPSQFIHLIASVNVTMPVPLTVHDSIWATPDTVTAGNMSILHSSGLSSTAWYDSTGTAVNDTIYPTVTTSYYVVGIDTNGCHDTLHVTVFVIQQIPNSCSFYPILDVQGPVTYASVYFPLLMADPQWGSYVHPLGGGYMLDSLPTTITFHGIFYADCYVDFKNCQHMAFAPGSEIRDSTHSKAFYIHGCHLYACQDTMWEGIYLNHSEDIKVTDHIVTPGDTVHTTIEDAHEAIEAGDSASFQAVNVMFSNNLTGINFYANITSSSSIHGCTFESDTVNSHGGSFLLSSRPTYNPSATQGKHGLTGINVGSSTSVTVGSSTSSAIDNKFLKLNMGILCSGSALNSYASYFERIKNYDPSFNFWYLKCGAAIDLYYATRCSIVGLGGNPSPMQTTFNNCIFGVYMIESNADILKQNMKLNYKEDSIAIKEIYGYHHKVNIKNNLINCRQAGVFLGFNTATTINVSQNMVNLDSGITSGAYGGIRGIFETEGGIQNYTTITDNQINLYWARFGIYLSKTLGTTASCNLINLLTNQSRYGIYLDGSKNFILNDSINGFPYRSLKEGIYCYLSSSNSIYGNMTDTVKYGLHFNGNNSGTAFKYNRIHNSYDGMLFQSASFNIGNNIGVAGGEGFGNQWLGPWAAGGYGAYATGPAITFHYKNTSPIYSTTGFGISPNPNASYNDSYISVCGGNPNWGNFAPPEDTSKIDTTSDYDEDYFSGYKYAQELYEYQLWRIDSTLSKNNGNLQTYYDSLSNSEIGQVEGLSQMISNDSAQVGYYVAQWLENDSLENFALKWVAYYDSIVETGNYSQLVKDSLSWWRTQASNHSTNATVLLHTIDSLRSVKADGLLTLNGNIIADDVWIENELVVNDLYLQTAYRGIDSFTSDQHDLLLYIALQCPEVGGPAVLRARSLFYMMEPTAYFDDDSLCADNERRANIRKPDALEITMYPNPTDGKVSFEFSEPLKAGMIEIYNEFGQLVGVKKMGSEETSTQLDLKNMSAGIYLCKIKSSGIVLTSQKLVLIR